MERKQPFMFFPSVQSRILVGLLSFTGIIIIVFWVAINEPARMQEFTERTDGRKIETGATLFESNCSTCHGNEGYGIANRAPALNNPVLFGYNFFTEQDNALAGIDAQLEAVDESDPTYTALMNEREKVELERLQVYDDLRYNYGPELAEFEAELAANPDDAFLQANVDGYTALMDAHSIVVNSRARQIEILEEMNSDEADLEVLVNEKDQLQTQIDTNIEAREVAFNDLVASGFLLRPFDPEFTPRLTELEWSGGTHAFIYSTLQSGRPVSSTYWDNPMAAWGQGAGGPLRNDEIEALSDYVMNWDREFTREDVRKIQQYAVIVPECVVAGTCAGEEGSVVEGPQLTDPLLTEDQLAYMEESMGVLNQFVGDPVNGQVIYNAQGCAGCHIVGGGGAGPDPTGLALRAEDYAAEFGYTDGSWYIAESIIDPGAYTVEGYTVLMVAPYWSDLTEQEIADVIAYLESFDS